MQRSWFSIAVCAAISLITCVTHVDRRVALQVSAKGVTVGVASEAWYQRLRLWIVNGGACS